MPCVTVFFVKNIVIAYFAILALCGLVALSVLGASLLQKGDPRGTLVLIIVAAGLLVTFIYGAVIGRKAEVQRPKVAKPPACRITTSTSSAEYAYPSAVVWSAIRPAEAAMETDSDVAHAFTVPAIPDGPGERQCFFGRNGSIAMLEVLEEVPERLAVTQSVFPPGEVSTRMVYRLEPTPMGCRLTIESTMETPDYMTPNQEAMQDFSDSFLENLEHLLEKRMLESAHE
jgi:hypothetical protein